MSSSCAPPATARRSTVKGDVSIVLDKLGVRDGTQAALLAVSLKRTPPKA